MALWIKGRLLPVCRQDFSPEGRCGLYITKTQELSDRPVDSLHQHQMSELGFCLGGHGKIFTDSGENDFGPGSVTFFPAEQPHFSASSPGTRSVWYWIYFSPQKIFADAGINAGIERLCADCFGGVFDSEYPALRAACKEFSDAAASAGEDLFDRFGLALSAGKLILEAARIGGGHERSFRTAKAIRFISCNFADNELMREAVIAREAGFGVSHMRSLFVKETGMPPREFISRTRLAAAADLLTGTDRKIIEIAEMCGFASLPGFNRSFRMLYDMTPGEYRRRYGRTDSCTFVAHGGV